MRGAPSLDAVLPALTDALGASVVVGHAVEFDLAIIGREMRARRQGSATSAFLDTQRLAAALAPDWPDVGLDAVAARVGVVIDGRHTARGDATGAGRVLLALLPQLTAHGVHTHGEARWLQARAPRQPAGRR